MPRCRRQNWGSIVTEYPASQLLASSSLKQVLSWSVSDGSSSATSPFFAAFVCDPRYVYVLPRCPCELSCRPSIESFRSEYPRLRWRCRDDYFPREREVSLSSDAPLLRLFVVLLLEKLVSFERALKRFILDWPRRFRQRGVDVERDYVFIKRYPSDSVSLIFSFAPSGDSDLRFLLAG